MGSFRGPFKAISTHPKTNLIRSQAQLKHYDKIPITINLTKGSPVVHITKLKKYFPINQNPFERKFNLPYLHRKIIALYHQVKTPIRFWCRRDLIIRTHLFDDQKKKNFTVALTGIHSLILYVTMNQRHHCSEQQNTPF